MRKIFVVDKELAYLVEGIEAGFRPDRYEYSGKHSDVYFDNNMCIKLFSNLEVVSGKSKKECEILEMIQGEIFAPILLAYNDGLYHVTEKIVGENILEYSLRVGKIPIIYYKSLYQHYKRMLELGISYVDKKENEHVIIVDGNPGQIKIIDYGVCDIHLSKQSTKYHIDQLGMEYSFLFGKADEYSLQQKLLHSGFPKSLVVTFISDLMKD